MFIKANLVLLLANAAKETTLATSALFAIALFVLAKAASEATLATLEMLAL